MNKEKKPHCSNCGKLNPEIDDYSDGINEGFTVCCNESVCRGEEIFCFGDESTFVEACCWGMAEQEFKRQNIDFNKLPFIQRWKKEE